jgi:hypothetical protein
VDGDGFSGSEGAIMQVIVVAGPALNVAAKGPEDGPSLIFCFSTKIGFCIRDSVLAFLPAGAKI